MVIHLASVVGGIGANAGIPDILLRNLIMGARYEAARSSVEVVQIGTSALIEIYSVPLGRGSLDVTGRD